MKSYMKKGFTLIELLVVVGILAVLAIAALIAINPVEAQRRSRDSARLQDMARLTATVETYINDNGTTGLASASHPAVTLRSQPCTASAHWLGAVDLCQYLKQVPLDPSNNRPISVLPSSAAGAARVSRTAGYGFAISAATGDYEFCTFLEAEKNRDLLNDGGGGGTDNVLTFETGIGTSTLTCTP